MNHECQLFEAALQLGAPWSVTSVEFQERAEAPGELHLFLDYPRGSHFPCAGCGDLCAVYDTDPQRVWRHLNFWQHPTLLHARLPRTRCAQCGVRTVGVPWARPESGFTLLFEAVILTLAKQMPMAALARLVGEHDTRLWRLVLAHVEAAQGTQDLQAVQQVGLDETTGRAGRTDGGPWGSGGRHYQTLVADLERGRLLFVAEGRDQQAVAAFQRFLQEHGGSAAAITAVSLDFGVAFQRGVGECFPQSTVVFDRFHVVHLLNRALEEVRRAETQSRPELKRTRRLWLTHPTHLTARQAERLAELRAQESQTARAYTWVQAVARLWDQPDRETARQHLWQLLAAHDASTPAPLLRVTETLRRYQRGILDYFRFPITNGLLEGLASLAQALKSRARGYRTHRYFAGMLYLTQGQLQLPPAT